MSDIVMRLQNSAFNEDKNLQSLSRQMGMLQNCPLSLMLEAAEEIRRLRANLKKAKEALRPFAKRLAEDEYERGVVSMSDLRRAASTLKEIDT